MKYDVEVVYIPLVEDAVLWWNWEAMIRPIPFDAAKGGSERLWSSHMYETKQAASEDARKSVEKYLSASVQQNYERYQLEVER